MSKLLGKLTKSHIFPDSKSGATDYSSAFRCRLFMRSNSTRNGCIGRVSIRGKFVLLYLCLTFVLIYRIKGNTLFANKFAKKLIEKLRDWWVGDVLIPLYLFAYLLYSFFAFGSSVINWIIEFWWWSPQLLDSHEQFIQFFVASSNVLV